MTMGLLIPTHKKLAEIVGIWKGDIIKALILYFSNIIEAI